MLSQVVFPFLNPTGYRQGGITDAQVRTHITMSVDTHSETAYITDVDIFSVDVFFRGKRYTYPKGYDLQRIVNLAENGSGLNRYLNSIRR